ncbi:MAG: HAMP domain-containing sensor histidine kinase [Candidatus Aminicenantes bacterium]|nr:HAMP domain-containing sensor histidine kinase [Candidatus Aminicenantes bacterium]
MNAWGRSKPLRLMFFAAVVLPCVVLAVLAVRSIDREEAFLEKRLQGTLDAELTHAVSLMQDELQRFREELASTAPAETGSDPRPALAAWKNGSPLVGVPFLLSADYQILWPTRDSFLAESDLVFLNWNREFVTNRKPTPVFENVALAFKEQIAAPPAGLSGGLQADALEKKTENLQAETPPAAAGRQPANVSLSASAKADVGKEKAAGKTEVADVQTAQQALAEFEQSDEARKRVYDEAARRGRKTESRNVTPGVASPKNLAAPRPESVFISDLLKFSEITSGKDSGFVPRFIEDKLTLLFWKREVSGRFIGCLVEDGAARGRLLARLPAAYSPARILTVLDENGRPLVTPEGQGSRDWRRPLVAREVSELLPRWEVAAYPTDPGALAAQAKSTRLLMAVAILGLCVLIAAAGLVILNMLRSEMILARQKTTFVTNVSHELKTPLTSIRMFSEMLKEGRQPDVEKQRSYLGLMLTETERLTRLINNVLDFSKMEKGKRIYAKTRMAAGPRVEAIVSKERVRLEHDGFTVTFTDSSNGAAVVADEEALGQAVLNLLTNAEKYSPENKRIEVEVSRSGGFVRVAVLDRGIGVPPAAAGKIFREFYRVDQSLSAPVSGSGLGLTIARRIARDHGGDIEFRPRDGGGSVFTILLPEAKEPA